MRIGAIWAAIEPYPERVSFTDFARLKLGERARSRLSPAVPEMVKPKRKPAHGAGGEIRRRARAAHAGECAEGSRDKIFNKN